MESMRDVLKRNLARSLQTLPPLDRLASAWTVACRPALARHGELLDLTDGILTILVDDLLWLDQLRSMRALLERDLARIAAVPLTAIHFQVRAPRPTPPKR